MTIQDALTTADTMRPNRIDDEQKIMWLSQLDGQIWNDTIVNHVLPDYIREMLPDPPEDWKTHQVAPGIPASHIFWAHTPWDEPAPMPCQRPPKLPDFPGYGNETDRGTQLLIREPYTDVYLFWLLSRIDLINQEMDLYQNDAALFNTALETFNNYWTRTYMPVQRVHQWKL